MNMDLDSLQKKILLYDSGALGLPNRDLKPYLADLFQSLFDEAEVWELLYHHNEPVEQLPFDLSTFVVKHDLTGRELLCKRCGYEMKIADRRIVDSLMTQSGKCLIRRDVYYSYDCPFCKSLGRSTSGASVPVRKKPLYRGIASAQALAEIILNKYENNISFFTQADVLQKNGLNLTPNHIAVWTMEAASRYFIPIYNELHRELLQEHVIQSDVVPLYGLNEPGADPEKVGQMWLYRTGHSAKHPIVLYKGEEALRTLYPRRFLTGFHGYLQGNGFPVYNALEPDIQVAGSWRQMGLLFLKAIKTYPHPGYNMAQAALGLQYINQIVEVEPLLKYVGPDIRLAVRREKTQPLLDILHDWAGGVKRPLYSSYFGKSLVYLSRHWDHLTKFMQDGDLELYNDLALESIKYFKAGHHFRIFNIPQEIKRSTAIVSLIQTAKENEVDLMEYMEYVLETAPNLDLEQEGTVQQLLPWNMPEDWHGTNIKAMALNVLV